MRPKKPNKKTQKEREFERKIRHLSSAFAAEGVEVRREKLARGSAFRVKSGNCLVQSDNKLFIDKRLPVEQQFQLLEEYLVQFRLSLSEETLALLSPAAATALSAHRENLEENAA